MNCHKVVSDRILKRSLMFASAFITLYLSQTAQALDIVAGDELVNMTEITPGHYEDTASSASIGIDHFYMHWDTGNSLKLNTSIERLDINIDTDINLGYGGGKTLNIGLEYDNWVWINSNIYGGGSLNIGPTSFFDYDGSEATSKTAVVIGEFNNPVTISDVDLRFNVNGVKVEEGSSIILNEGDNISHFRSWYDRSGLNGGGFISLYGIQDIRFQNDGRIEQLGINSTVDINGFLESGDYVLQGGRLTTESTDVTGVFEQYAGTTHRLEDGALDIRAGSEYIMHGGQLYADRIVTRDTPSNSTADPGKFTYHDGGVRLTNQDIYFRQKDSAVPNDYYGLYGDLGAHIVMDSGEIFGARNMIVGTPSGMATSSHGSIHLDGGWNYVDNDMTINALGSVTQDSGQNWIDNDLLIIGGDYTQNNGNNVVDGTINISDFGSYTQNNGNLTAGRILGSGYNYVNGGVRLTNSDMHIRSGGTLGISDLLIDEGERFGAVNMTVGTAIADSGSILQTTGSNIISNQLTINAGGQYDIAGGLLEFGSFAGEGKINFTRGEVYISGGTAIGSAGPFGSDLTLNDNMILAMYSSSYSPLQSVTIDDGANLMLNGGELYASEIISNGTFEYISGRLQLDTLTFGATGPLGSFTVTNDHSLTVRNNVNIESGATVTLTNGSINGDAAITNNGMLVLNGGSLSASQINNTVSGSFGFSSGSLSINTLDVGSSGLLGSTVILGSTKSINADTVNVDADSRLEVNGGGSSVGNLTNEGVVVISQQGRLSGGTYTQNTSNASTTVDGVLNANVDVTDGELTGSGTINGNAINGGSIGPGQSPGILTVAGNYTQTEFGTLHIEIGGLFAGDEYDVLNIGGDAFLGGVLDVDLYDFGGGLFAPSLGDTFDFLTAETIMGEFDLLSLMGLGNGLGWQLDYLYDEIGTTDVARLTIVEVSAVPVPAAVWLFGSGLIGLAGIARRKKA